MTQPKWRKFEELVAHIHTILDPTAKVQHNVKILGKSGNKRQIDVLLEKEFSYWMLRQVIECKDYKRPVSEGLVEEFIGKIDDVGANQGVMVSPSGFTKGAVKRANTAGIILMLLEDALVHPWQQNIENAYLRTIIYHPTKYDFTLHKLQPSDEYLTRDGRIIFIDENGNELTDQEIANRELESGFVKLLPGNVAHRVHRSNAFHVLTTKGPISLFALDMLYEIEVFGVERLIPITDNFRLTNITNRSEPNISCNCSP